MTAPLRLGIIGAGQAYARLYHPALNRSAGFEIAGTADPVAPASHRTPESLLDAGPLDAVVVLSPPALHAEHVALSLGRGLPVLVEKPPATSRRAIDAWTFPQMVTPAFSRRYWPGYARPLGPGRHFVFDLQTNPAAWGNTARAPVEWDLLPHAADLAAWLSGEAISAVEEVVRVPGCAKGTFILAQGGRFEWRVAHGGGYRESLVCDGRELGPRAGPARRVIDRLRGGPPIDVAAVAALLSDWSHALRGEPPATLPGIGAARTCAAVIEAVESVPLAPAP